MYDDRLKKIITPAIESLDVDGVPLCAKRVDISSSGDSILTEINDGVSNSRLVLADISTVGRDSTTGVGYRNANVLYEVGLALACRQPTDVLLIRDDHDRFLFDVSTIPHATLDFTKEEEATKRLGALLQSRLDEQKRQLDARVDIKLASLSLPELYYVIPMAQRPESVIHMKKGGKLRTDPGFPRLLDAGVLKLVGRSDIGDPSYGLTPIGLQVAKRAFAEFGRLHMDE